MSDTGIWVGLLLGHLLGDFVFQPKAWVEERNRLRFRSPALYFHGLVQGLLAALVMASAHALWALPVVLVTHVLIDGAKSTFAPRGAFSFVFDQLLHLGVLIGVGLGAELRVPDLIPLGFSPEIAMLYVFFGLFLTRPSGFFIQELLDSLGTVDKAPEESLRKTGFWIGALERLLIFFFVISGSLASIGFLLAAKSVFRFGDLRESQDRMRTEYVLLGTLLSFGLALGASALCLYLSTLWNTVG